MNLIPPLLSERKSQLRELLVQKETAYMNAPEGSLKASIRGKSLQYYHAKPHNARKPVYLKKQDLPLAAGLAQKEYDHRLITSIRKEMKLLDDLLLFYADDAPEDVLYKMTEPKIPLVNAAYTSTEEYIKAWLSVKYNGNTLRKNNRANSNKQNNNSSPGNESHNDKISNDRSANNEKNDPDHNDLPSSPYVSANGEEMRSKSEVMIADYLLRCNIPYRYEYPVRLKGKVFYPDFCILKLSNRQEMIWEHFGLIDDHDYRDTFMAKMELYQANGYYPGINMITTYETFQHPLNMKILAKIVEAYCR